MDRINAAHGIVLAGLLVALAIYANGLSPSDLEAAVRSCQGDSPSPRITIECTAAVYGGR